MPYWNKYPLRDRAGDHAKPAANLTSRGMGVPARHDASLRATAETARLAAEAATAATAAEPTTPPSQPVRSKP